MNLKAPFFTPPRLFILIVLLSLPFLLLWQSLILALICTPLVFNLELDQCIQSLWTSKEELVVTGCYIPFFYFQVFREPKLFQCAVFIGSLVLFWTIQKYLLGVVRNRLNQIWGIPWRTADIMMADLEAGEVKQITHFAQNDYYLVQRIDGIKYYLSQPSGEMPSIASKYPNLTVLFSETKGAQAPEAAQRDLRTQASGILAIGFMLLLCMTSHIGICTCLKLAESTSIYQTWFLVPQEEQINHPLTLEDVAGYKEAKAEFIELVRLLKTQTPSSIEGLTLPKGVLMVGPPGTGKTYFAKALGGSANLPVITVSGSDFRGAFVGEGASRLRELFAKAKRIAPCILFIDEIDVIGIKRDLVYGGDHQQTLNQLLSEMDGFTPTSGILVIAATNFAGLLDPALKRPGRFDREIGLTYPSLNDRVAILEQKLKNVVRDETLNLNNLAKESKGFSGADLAVWVNESALFAEGKGFGKVTEAAMLESLHILRAKGRINMPDFDSVRSRLIMAYQIAACAVVSEALVDLPPVKYASLEQGTRSFQSIQFEKPDTLQEGKLEWEAELILRYAHTAVIENKFGASALYEDLSKYNAYTLETLLVGIFRYGFEVDGKIWRFSHQDDESLYSGRYTLPAELESKLEAYSLQLRSRAEALVKTHAWAIEHLAERLVDSEPITKEAIQAALETEKRFVTKKSKKFLNFKWTQQR